MIQMRWIEMLLLTGGIATIVALFASEAARSRRPSALSQEMRTPRSIDRPGRQAADYRISGVLPPWRS